LPLLLLLLAFVVDAGRLFADYHALGKGVRDAARYLARVEGGAGGLALDCATGTVDRGAPAVQDAIRLAMTGRIDGDPAADAETLVGGWTAPELSAAATGIRISLACTDNGANALRGLYDGAGRIPSIVVSAEVPFTLGPGRLLGLGPRLRLTRAYRTPHTGT